MKTLAKKAKNGDITAFAGLIKENENTLYRIAASYLKNDADIADAVQDTILSCWENIKALREPKYFKSWMIRILINHCMKTLKNRKKEIPFEILPENASVQTDKSNLEFRDMMDCLAEKNRIVLTLFYGEDLSVKQIANLLDISEQTVKQRLHRGRLEVKEKYLGIKESPDNNMTFPNTKEDNNIRKVTL